MRSSRSHAPLQIGPREPIVMFLGCVPPKTTAQKKGVRLTATGVQFFHKRRLVLEERTWAALLAPHRPRLPILGAVELSVRFVYPHLRSTAKRHRGDLVAKISKPDCGNAAKHLEDLLTKMRFIEDDSRVARLLIEKFHGPDDQVGIGITIRPFVIEKG